jgi:hypothetical protein
MSDLFAVENAPRTGDKDYSWQQWVDYTNDLQVERFTNEAPAPFVDLNTTCQTISYVPIVVYDTRKF